MITEFIQVPRCSCYYCFWSLYFSLFKSLASSVLQHGKKRGRGEPQLIIKMMEILHVMWILSPICEQHLIIHWIWNNMLVDERWLHAALSIWNIFQSWWYLSCIKCIKVGQASTRKWLFLAQNLRVQQWVFPFFLKTSMHHAQVLHHLRARRGKARSGWPPILPCFQLQYCRWCFKS